MRPSHWHPLRFGLALGLALLVGTAAGCGPGDEKPAAVRGLKNVPKPGGAAAQNGGSRRTGVTRAGGDDGVVDEGPERPPITLDEKSFSRRRDPFRTFVVTERPEPEPDSPRAARKVKLAQYGFEDLRLVIIVNSGRRGIKPRAQFVGGDGRSGTVMQGEYFSSAEVLLAAVNRDYVEVEVVDEDLASALGLKRGERRTIFLRND